MTGEAPVHPRVLFPAHPTSRVHFDKAVRAAREPAEEMRVVADEQQWPLKRWHLEARFVKFSVGEPGAVWKSNEDVEGGGLYSRAVPASIGARNCAGSASRPQKRILVFRACLRPGS